MGAHVEVTGRVLAVDRIEGALLLTVDGEWSITDLGADGLPVAVQAQRGVGDIAAPGDVTVSEGDLVEAYSSVSLTGSSLRVRVVKG